MIVDNYWTKRINLIFDKYEKSIKVNNLYHQSYSRILEEVEGLYKASYKRKLSRTELYRVAKFLSFKSVLMKETKGLGITLNSTLENRLKKAYKAAGLCAKNVLGKDSEWTVLNQKMAEACVQRKWAGGHFSKRIWTNRAALARTLETGIVDCIINGKSQNELINNITENWNAGRRRANTLVRTELAHTVNTAQIETYKSEGVHYLDFDCEPSACDICLEAASGNPWRINNIPFVIGHPNCRCTWLPVEDDDIRLKRKK